MAANTLISVRLSKEAAGRLAALAQTIDRSKSYVASQAIEEFLALHEWQVKAIRQGIKEANEGKFVPHEVAREILRKWGRREA